MKDDALILAKWDEAVEQNEAAILATVVKVSGSAYRSPGARMLVTDRGGRTGSISGGCLEGEILRKAWWLTAGRGAAVQIYDNTSEEEAVWEFGLGCNGIVHVLLERWEPRSSPVTIDLLRACQSDGRGGVLASAISGPSTGGKLALFPDGTCRSELSDPDVRNAVEREANLAFSSRRPGWLTTDRAEFFLEYISPPVALLIVGAGQDALPVVRFAKELGWGVTVVDGRSNFARHERFPEADRVVVLDPTDPLRGLTLDDRTAVVLMSHSYQQDSEFLAALRGCSLCYLGILGPRKRTERMMGENGHEFANLHSPTGLDIGADTPEEIALAVVSEIQAVISNTSGGMLTQKRGPIHAARRKGWARQAVLG